MEEGKLDGCQGDRDGYRDARLEPRMPQGKLAEPDGGRRTRVQAGYGGSVPRLRRRALRAHDSSAGVTESWAKSGSSRRR